MSQLSLPSIQSLLQEAPGPNVIRPTSNPPSTKRQFGHGQSQSVSSLPLDLQSLSLQAPKEQTHTRQPYNGIPFTSNEKTPSWMMIPNRTNNNDTTRRKATFTRHGRSISEFTLPPLSPIIAPLDRSPFHRRAVSANTIDFMMPSRAQSPTQEPDVTSHALLLEQDTTPTASESTGRYVCPYCLKKFTRPSSLRIHTYSHTGEKPFVCEFSGCARQFSVQSNMRRHLRVHRLGRSGNNITLERTSEEF